MTICDRCGTRTDTVCVSRECKRTPDITPPGPRPLSDRERALVEAARSASDSIEVTRMTLIGMGRDVFEGSFIGVKPKLDTALAPYQAIDGD